MGAEQYLFLINMYVFIIKIFVLDKKFVYIIFSDFFGIGVINN